MFWKLVKYELQSVRKWYLGIYGISILLSIPLGLMLQKLTVTFETATRNQAYCLWLSSH